MPLDFVFLKKEKPKISTVSFQTHDSLATTTQLHPLTQKNLLPLWIQVHLSNKPRITFLCV